MRVRALAKRIIQQFIHDKRSMALMFVAPILILTLLSLVFNSDPLEPKIGLVKMPDPVVQMLQKDKADISKFNSDNTAKLALEEGTIHAYLSFDNGSVVVHLEGSDPTVTQAVMSWIQESVKNRIQSAIGINIKTEFQHGSKSMNSFDSFGPVLVGFFAFFFVFLLAGVSFLRERTGGTLERLICSPMKLWEIVVGYVIGFGLFTLIQAAIISTFSVYVLDLMMEGSFFYVLLTTVLLSFTALTLGILLSAFANNELQMIQFIPIVIVPSVFFSGIFNLETMSSYISWIGAVTPLFYAAKAMRDVMIRGLGLGEISNNLLVLVGFSLIFMTLNIFALRKYRKG
ncbi:MAG: type transporter [Bacillales bacterium]|jgi:ABC-2 type transport system permease protein|nr:type transporter [Bacillales bacterium]